MTKTIIIPGLDGSPAPHWQDWWLSVDRQAVSVRQADWSAADAPGWDRATAAAIRARPGSFVVAHSLGVISLVRLAATDPALPVRGALLVAPADVERGEGANRLAHFGPIPRDLLSFSAVVVASRNDPWTEFARSEEFAWAWGAAFIDIGYAGHINAEAGYGPWPEGMALLEQIVGMTSSSTGGRPCRHVEFPGGHP